MSLLMENEELNSYKETKMGDEKRVDISSNMKKLEEYFMDIFDKILLETSYSEIICCLYMVVSFIQLFSIPFDQTLDFKTDDSLGFIINTVTSNLGIYEIIINSENAIWYYMAAYISCAFIIYYIVMLIFAGKANLQAKVKEYVSCIRSLSKVTPFLYWILFMPMTRILLAIYRCNNDTDTLFVDSNLKCWSAVHIIHIVLLSIFNITILLVVIMIAIFGNDTNPYNYKNPFRRFDWNFEIFFVISRVVIIVLGTFIPDGILRNSIVVWLLLAISIRFLLFYKEYYPFYSYYMGMIYEICSYSSVMISLILVLNEIVRDYFSFEYEGLTLLIFGGLLGTLRLVYKSHFQQIYSMVLHKHQSDISSEEDFNKYINGLISLVSIKLSPSHEFSQVMLEGFIVNHNMNCKDPQCPLNDIDQIFNISGTTQTSEAKHNDHVRLIHLIQFIYKGVLQQGGNASGLIQAQNTAELWHRTLINYAYFLIFKLGHLHAAAVELERIVNMNPCIHMRIAVWKAKTLLGRLYDANNAKKMVRGFTKVTSIDPRLLLEYEAMFNHFKQEVFKVAEKYREIWIQLLSPFPDLTFVQKNSIEAVKQNAALCITWDRLSKLFYGFSKAEMLYSMYLSEVLGHEELAEKHMRKYKGILSASASINEQMLADKAIFENDICVIAMSGMPENLGNVIKASSGVTKMFEYSPTELIGKSVTMIMPQFIADHHPLFVKNYLQNATNMTMQNEFDSFGCDKQQFIFLVKILTRQYYDLTYGSVFIAMIKAYPPQCMIVTDVDGIILGISREGSRALGSLFTPIFLKESSLKMQYICPYLGWKANEPEEGYNKIIGQRDIIFAIPSNFSGSANFQPDNIKENANIQKQLENENCFKRQWRCLIVNVKHQHLKLKAFYFKGKGKKVTGSSEASWESQDYECDIIEKHMDNCEYSEENKSSKEAFSQSLLPNNKFKVLPFMSFNKLKKPENEPIVRKPTLRSCNNKDFDENPLNRQSGNSLELKLSFSPDSKIQSSSVSSLENHPQKIPIELISKEVKDFKSSMNGLEEPNSPDNKKDEEEELQKATRTSILQEIELLKKTDSLKYIPPATKRVLRCSFLHMLMCIIGCLSFFTTMLMSLDNLGRNYEIIQLEREASIIQISEAVRSLLFMANKSDGSPILDASLRNYNYFSGSAPKNNSNQPAGTDAPGPPPTMSLTYTEWKLGSLRDFGKQLIDAQKRINQQIVKFNDPANKEQVNPSCSNITFPDGTTKLSEFSTHITMFSNEAMKVASYSISNVSITNTAVNFLLANSYAIFLSGNYESEVMMKEIVYMQKIAASSSNFTLYFICGLGVIMFFIMLPFWLQITNLGQITTNLLLKITSKQLKEQILHCGKFMRFVNSTENEDADADFDDWDEFNEEHKTEEKDGEKQEKTAGENLQDEKERLLKGNSEKTEKKKSRKRKSQVYSDSILALIIVFIIFHIIIDSVFIFFYLWPQTLNENVSEHLREYIMLRTEYKSQLRLFVIMLELFRNGNISPIPGATMSELVKLEIANSVKDIEIVFNHHEKYNQHFSKTYTQAFLQAMYVNMCQDAFNVNVTECASLDSGIMTKGLYAQTVQYLRRLNEMTNMYNRTAEKDRTPNFLRSLINSQEFIIAELILRKYHGSVTKAITTLLEQSFRKVVDANTIYVIVIFIVCLGIVMLMYLLIWQTYINRIRDRILKTKMTLCHIPLNVIMETEEIKKYFFEASQDIMLNSSKKQVKWII